MYGGTVVMTAKLSTQRSWFKSQLELLSMETVFFSSLFHMWFSYPSVLTPTKTCNVNSYIKLLLE